MSSGDNRFLSFLEELNPTAVQIANKMEELIFEDASSAIVKARKFAETILKDVIKIEKLEVPSRINLYEMILMLSKEEIITKDVQKTLDTIRIIGNKAAHEGSNDEDLTQAFKLHKEMYKLGVWYYEVYSSNHDFKIPPYEKPQPMKKIEAIIEQKVKELLQKDEEIEEKKIVLPQNDFIVEKFITQEFNYNKLDFNEDLILTGESYLERMLSRLTESSQEAVENAHFFSDFKDYLHVERSIQKDLENILKRNREKKSGHLILLCGNVGDGKSHLLAYLKKNKLELIEKYKIHNDATESFSPYKDAMETLEEVLKDFSDQNLGNCTEKLIVAINMGILHNFLNTKHRTYTFNKLKKFIKDSGLFSRKIITHYSNESFDLLSFGDYQPYELTEEGPKSIFFSTLLQKITQPSDDNPFYLAYKKDIENNIHTMTHENFNLLQNKSVQNHIVQLVIQAIVTMKLVISARTFLNFIADILMPNDKRHIKDLNEFEIIERSLPNLLFTRKDRSSILNAISKLDPIHIRTPHIDNLVMELNTLNDWKDIINSHVLDETAEKWLYPFNSKDKLTGHSFYSFIKSFIRITFLINNDFYSKNVCQHYKKYMENLYYFNTKNVRKIKSFYDDIKKAIFEWKGSPKKDYIYLDKNSYRYRLAQKLNLHPTIEHLMERNEKELDSFKTKIELAYVDDSNNNRIFLDIDFPLYSLLMKVLEGYCPNKNDEENAIKFVEFIEKIMDLGEKRNEILVYFPSDGKTYLIKRDEFGAFVFERE